ncbi:MAG: alpha/beta hydrolase [Pseudomonadota bacterium]
MTDFAERTTQASDGTRLYYRDYAPRHADAAAIPVLCLPGLTRSSRDFAALADVLSASHRVICPDLRGRGHSGYAADPATYVPLQYIKDLKILLADADVGRFAIVGTSLGGILAMTLAGTMRHQIAAVVMNDVGPDIDPKGIERIQGYVGKGGPVADWPAAAAAVKAVNHQAMPHYTPDQWEAMARLQYTERDGQVVPNYDANIAKPFEAGASTPALTMWPFYEALKGLPLLLIRGETSDILNASTADKMIASHGSADYLEVARVGHAPMLDEPGVTDRIAAFLAAVPARQGVIGWVKSRLKSLSELSRIAKALKQAA